MMDVVMVAMVMAMLCAQGELDGARKEATAAKIAQAQARSDLGYLRERMDALEGTSQAQQR